MTTLPEWVNWLAREEDGSLMAFERKPHKDMDDLLWGEPENYGDSISFDETNRVAAINETDDTFSHIKWTDEEPTSVKAESLRELGESLTRNWEAEHGKPSVAEYNQWQITQAKAHGYDELPAVPDIINEPSHYKGRHGLEAIEVVRNFGNDDMVAGFYWGNAIKYMTRYRNKNGLEDLKKARKNLDWLIEHMEAIE